MRFLKIRFMVALAVIAVLATWTGRLALQAQGPAFTPALVIHAPTNGVAFGAVGANATSPQKTITLQNIGNATLTVTASTVPVAPLTDNDFAVAFTNCATVAPNAYCTVSMSFTPTANGPKIARLLLQTSASPNAYVVPLVGQGVVALLVQPSVGPIDARTGFPYYFSDGKNALELCLDNTPPLDAFGVPLPQTTDVVTGILTPTMCLAPAPDPLRAPAVTDNPLTTNFDAEGFYWSAEALMDVSVAGAGPGRTTETRLLLVQAQEAAFATPVAKAGEQWGFGRLRVRVDDAVPFARYRVTHPFGVDIHEASALRVFATSDVGCFSNPCDFTLALPGTSRISNFLVCQSPAPPTGYLGDPNILCTITGSPSGTNFFRVEREVSALSNTWTIVGETNMFALSGKLTTPITAPPPTNQGPNAIDDVASTPFNTAVIIAVLNNDTDPNADVLAITTVTNSLNGTAAINGSTITYTPNAAFTTGGVDTFQYAVSDPGGLTDTATVRVTVGAIPPGNRAPIATNDVFMLLPDVIFPDPQMLVTAPGVLENDVDPDGNVLTVELLTGPAANPSAPGYPTFALSPDGSFLYNHGVGIAAGASPTPVTFTYRVSDGLLVSNVATATINVTRPVGQPIANNDAMTTQMNTAITYDVDANDTNGTAGVTTNTGLLQPTLTIQRPPVNGLALVVRPVATGVDRRVTYTPNPGFVGVDTFTYTIMDNQNFTSNVATVTVTVNTPVAVPNVIGAAQAAASVTITGAGLTVGTITQVASATVASGNVISSNPAAGTLVAPGSPVALVLSMGVLVGADPTQVLMVFSQGTGNRTAAVTTVTAGVTLVAFVGADGPAGPDGQAATVSGGGLTWTRVVQQRARSGVAEIWTATAPGLLTAAGITSTLSTAGFLQQITVIGFTNVSAVGASYGASTPGTAAVTASIGLVTQSAGSLVYGVGLDWATVSARTVGAGQTKLREYVPLPFIASWVQRLNGVAGAAGSSVTLTTTAPTSNAWNMAAIELMR